jgi:hypothetical protein
LKAGAWFRRARLLIVSPALRPSWPLSGRNSTYPAVQVCQASSLTAQVNAATFIMTDEGGAAKKVGGEFSLHGSVNHSIGEYVRGDIHTNTIEGYFSILKRGINGVYHHVSQEHLKRYLAEFDFRYNERMALDVSDMERTTKAIKGIVGKRLTYRRPNEARL